MDLNLCLARLWDNAAAIRQLVQGVSVQQARWKPDPASWSILEVITHLYDEEREDFRAHLETVLLQPDTPWSRIDPEDWVTSRKYNARPWPAALDEFLMERQVSIRWLRELGIVDWQAPYPAPFSPITGGDLLASWVAHDLLHMRQLVELQWAYTTGELQPYEVSYAGDW